MAHAPLERLAALVLLALAAAGCASKLRHQVQTKTPSGLEVPVDLAQVTFTDVHDGAAVNLGDYMRGGGREFLLLVFGSKSCDTCVAEAGRLRDEGIGHYPLIDQDNRFEIVGVTTDPDSPRQLAGYVASYPFIKWNDHAGLNMRTFFLPKGAQLKVPLTVMLSADGKIAWRILPDDANQTTVGTLMGQVAATLGLAGGGPDGGTTGGAGGATGGAGGATGGAGGATGGGTGSTTGGGTAGGTGGTTGGGTGGTTGGGTTGGGTTGGGDGPALDLAQPGPGRLEKVQLTACDGHGLSLDGALGNADYKFVVSTAGPCGDACQADLAELAALRCDGVTCAVAALQTDAPSAAACAGGHVYKGGLEFYTAFATHFNWAYTPIEQPNYKLSLPPVAGPLVFAFSAAGRLVYSYEGKLAPGQLAQVVAAPDFGKALARGPDFGLYTQALGTFKFADLRRQAKFTVLGTWGAYPVPCGSCIKQLQHWSAPGELAAYCAARPADCQLLALESHPPQAPATTLAGYFAQLTNGDGGSWAGLQKEGITVPLVLDPVPDPDGNNYLHRLFDGYMQALDPDGGAAYRTLIYDQEGKVVMKFLGESPPGPDPVLAGLKQLLGR